MLEANQITTQTKLSPSGNQKPSEPASPSPPSSPYFTESPTHVSAQQNVPGPSETSIAEVESKTPSKKQQKATSKEKAVGDFFTQQKRAFAELDGFLLEVEVTPKRARKSSIPSLKPPATPMPSLPAPNTVPRARTSKRVKFESAESGSLLSGSNNTHVITQY